MAVYFVTGNLGAGKTLAAVGRIRDYVNQGRRVATNLDIYCDQFRRKKNRNVDITRIPDKPSVSDLDAIGQGYAGTDVDENRYGLLVLDECGTWFNSRNWNDKGRKAVNDWFLHARKLRWDVLFIVQDLSIIDSQARETIAEHTVFCKRLDRVAVPFTAFTKLLGFRLRLPKIHRAIVKYGTTKTSLTVDTWTYMGHDLYKLYDTEQAFGASHYWGPASMLTPWHLVGRYEQTTDWIRMANTYLLPFIRVTVFYPAYLLSKALPWLASASHGRAERLRLCP